MKPREECWRSLNTWNHLTVEIIHAGHRIINTLRRERVRFIRKNNRKQAHASSAVRSIPLAFPFKACVRQISSKTHVEMEEGGGVK